MLLSLCHIDLTNLPCTDLAQARVQQRQVAGLGNQATEPQYLRGMLTAFFDHLLDEGQLAAGAPEFVMLSAEVEGGQLPAGVELAKVAPFAD